MSHSFSKNYPVRIWISTILLGAVILIFLALTFYNQPKDDGIVYSYLSGAIFFGAVFSWPSFLLFYFSFQYLRKKHFRTQQIKIFLGGIAVFGMLGTCLFFGLRPFKEEPDTVVIASYTAAIMLSLLLNKIKNTDNQYYTSRQNQ